MPPVRDQLLGKMKALAKSYVPEWSFTGQEPDAGSTLAILYKNMLDGSLERYSKVLHKHKIQYLNLFDRFKEEPAESAKSFVQFTPVTGAPGAVHVPSGTRLLAQSGKTEHPVVFETSHGLTVTPANIAAIFTTDGSNGAISRQFLSDEKQSAGQCTFTAFHTGDDNLEEHVLLLGFADTFDNLDRLDLELLVSTASEDDLENVFDILSGKDITFSILCQNGFEAFDKVEREDNVIRLQKENWQPRKTAMAGKECCQIAITAEKLAHIQMNGIKVRFRGEHIIPDEVRCGGVAQNPGHFRPFGLPMEIYAACEMESKTVFARKGARTELSFTLDFEVIEQLLPEYETEAEYKVVMKKPPSVPKPVIQEVHADYVLLEYLSETGWKRLVHGEHAAMLFNGSERGELSISFTMPSDMLSEQYATGQPRMRFRLLRADNLYRIPCRQYCPVIEDIRYSYSYEEHPVVPDCAVTRNNSEAQDVTGLFAKNRNVELFYSKEHDKPAIYLGFDENPWGTPISVYFGIENSADCPVDFTAEYLSPAGFVPVKVADGTGGMLSSGAMLMIVGKDAARCARFGQELFWIRLINHNKENISHRLPLVTGIYLNMARVENIRTQTRYFYMDNSDSALNVSLGEAGLISARVYVNEENDKDGDNWVLWRKAEYREQQGRVYDIDLGLGRIAFEKNIFAAYPVREDGPAVKVVFQSYHGSSANVEAGKINALASSIRFLSEVKNPMPAFGGYDGFNEETSAAVISNMLRTRGRAVSRQDYFDLISQVSYGVRRVKCLSGQNLRGEPQEDAVTIAVLIDEYEKGGHIFSGVKEAIRQKLLTCSGIIPMGKTLILTQPRFVHMSVRLWLLCERMENAYDIQQQCGESIRSFIDPLRGGFDGNGWEIGILPTPTQLVAFLKIRHPNIVVSKIMVTAVFENREYAVDDGIGRHITSPFAMAVNGEHVVYSQLMEE